MFVVVHPKFPENAQGITLSNGDRVAPGSDYLLICDGRPTSGMRCEVATEAAMQRMSFTPKTGNASSPVDEGVCVLGCTDEVKIEEKVDKTPPPPPPVVLPPVPPAKGSKATHEPPSHEPAPPPPPPPAPTTPAPGGVK